MVDSSELTLNYTRLFYIRLGYNKNHKNDENLKTALQESPDPRISKSLKNRDQV